MAKKKPGSQQNADTPEDAFVARLLALSKWAENNVQVLAVAGIVLALAFGAGIYYFNYQEGLRLQAAQELQQIQQTVGAGDTEAARTELETFLQRYGNTAYGTEARILLAELDLRGDQAQDAVSVLEPATRSLSEPLSLQAAFLLGTAYEQAGRGADAERLYLRITDAADLDFQVRQALAAAARIRARDGRYAEAADLYQRILDSYEGEEEQGSTATEERREYQLRLAEMRAAAR